MQKLLFKRTLRDLKTNAFRYLALFLLIILALFMIIGTVGSAQSIIRTVDEKADANHLEDGQFHVFYPLKEENLQTLHDMGITLEECFYLDFQMEDESTLRLMKNRTKINTLELAEGTVAAADDEIVLERIYAAAHDIREGETITVAENHIPLLESVHQQIMIIACKICLMYLPTARPSVRHLSQIKPMKPCLTTGHLFIRKNTATATCWGTAAPIQT